jgi:type IV pilus biogenesis protein CpaD/CtpE
MPSRCDRLVIFIATAVLCACASRPIAVGSASRPQSVGDVQCHIEPVTGSLLKTRVCLTRAQREAREALTDEMKGALQRQRSIACPNGSAPPCKP